MSLIGLAFDGQPAATEHQALPPFEAKLRLIRAADAA